MPMNPVSLSSLFESIPDEWRGGDPWNMAMAFSDLPAAMGLAAFTNIANNALARQRLALLERQQPWHDIYNPELEAQTRLVTQGQVPLAVQASHEKVEGNKLKEAEELRKAQWAQQLGLEAMKEKGAMTRHQTPSGDTLAKAPLEAAKFGLTKSEAESKALDREKHRGYEEEKIGLQKQGQAFQEKKLRAEDTRAMANPMTSGGPQGQMMMLMREGMESPQFQALKQAVGEDAAMQRLKEVVTQQMLRMGLGTK